MSSMTKGEYTASSDAKRYERLKKLDKTTCGLASKFLTMAHHVRYWVNGFGKRLRGLWKGATDFKDRCFIPRKHQCFFNGTQISMESQGMDS